MLSSLAIHQLPCLVVDDGSDAEQAATLDRVSQCFGWVTLLRHDENAGKGAAVKTGLRSAHDAGLTHIFQIDADGQHDLQAVESFLQSARSAPDKTILGQPVFDSTISVARLWSRYLTHVWVWINTLSREITDSMCGFRIYPVEATLATIESRRIGEHMEFDIEVLVRMHWAGMRFLMLPVATSYPGGGRSHFRLLRDNVLISAVHAKLFFGMLIRLPTLIRRNF